MSEFLGLLVDETPEILKSHLEAINSLEVVPIAFKAKDLSSIPDAWESPVPAWNQGQTSSCAGHAGAANFTHRQFVETQEIVKYSPWFMYIESQKRGGFSGKDGGTSIRSVIDAATQDGCCLESLCQRPSQYSMRIEQAALQDATAHKHNGGIVDLRDWDTLIDWITDLRSVVIGTRWYSTQSSVRDTETKALANGGSFRGYHARAIIGWKKIGDEICPRVLNSHGTQWGTNGRATIEHATWDTWRKDSNFVALGFTDINERIPQRKNPADFQWVGAATPGWLNQIA
jgi:hypothetical protein